MQIVRVRWLNGIKRVLSSFRVSSGFNILIEFAGKKFTVITAGRLLGLMESCGNNTRVTGKKNIEAFKRRHVSTLLYKKIAEIESLSQFFHFTLRCRQDDSCNTRYFLFRLKLEEKKRKTNDFRSSADLIFIFLLILFYTE